MQSKAKRSEAKQASNAISFFPFGFCDEETDGQDTSFICFSLLFTSTLENVFDLSTHFFFFSWEVVGDVRLSSRVLCFHAADADGN